MTAVLIVLGVVALVPALIALGVVISMWRAWWLHPLWSLLIVPLGMPQIGFWHFVAIGMFWYAWLATHHNTSSDSKAEATSKFVVVMLVQLLWPLVTFYLVRWCVS